MIIYDNRDIYFIIFRKAGSVVLTSMVLLPALLSTLLCAVLLYASEDEPMALVSPNCAKIYSTILGFVVVFRTQLAFGRFFEGIAHVQMLFSKWRDAFSSVMAFIECSIAEDAKAGRRKNVEELIKSKAKLLHWFTLVSALSVQELQEEDELDAIFDDDEEEQNTEEVSQNRLCIIKEPTNRLRPPSSNRGSFDSEETGGPAVGKLCSSGVGARLVTGSAEEYFAAGKHQFLNPRSSGRMEHPLWVSGSEAPDSPNTAGRSRGASFPDSQGSGPVPTLEQRRKAIFMIGEVSAEECRMLSRARDTVHLVTKWIQSEISSQVVTGRIKAPPPIVSRVYQELSNGMQAYLMAKIKISTVPFPFPFAQVLSYCLLAFYFGCPFMICEIVDQPAETSMYRIAVPLLLNFATCAGYGAVNEIAIELEAPFGFDANDYPVNFQQTMIIQAMEDTYFARAPQDFQVRNNRQA
mmetsp:Transcript_85856/g.188547  ORF Transcript_85856/g.188547 Transcript_85856/m.188547 type:complete len:465 (+) Transcript_85856:257-1651(+)